MNKILLKNYLPDFAWLFYYFIAVKYFQVVSIIDDEWSMGDWLINYCGGAVRRGLIGTIILYISEPIFSLRWTTYLVQILFYMLIYLFVIKIYKLRERDWTWSLFLFSPAFILFPFYDLQGGFRKEIIVFSIFAFLCLCYSKKEIKIYTLFLSSTIFALAAFSHELTSFTIPFFIYIFYKFYRHNLVSKGTALCVTSVYCTLSISALLFAYFFKGDFTIAAEICNSLLTNGFTISICDGALSWLDKDPVYIFVSFNINLTKYIIFYTFALCVAVAPIFLISAVKREIIIIILIGFVFILPLCLVAVDWGRWIHIYIFFVFCLILSESVWNEIELRRVPVVIIVAYLVSWSIPHTNSYNFRGGFIGFILYQINYIMKIVD